MKLGAAACGLALVAVGPLARGADADEAACLASHRQTQELELESKLVAAEAEAVRCSQASCPEEVRTMCAGFVARIRASQPTVVVVVRGPGDSDLRPDEISIDGRPEPRALGGAAVVVDPGEHKAEARLGSGPPVSATFVAKQGEKDRKIVLLIADDAAGPRFSPWAHVLGGLGAATLVAFGGVAVATKVQADSLDRECGDRCARERPDDVDAVVRQAVAADVCLGVGLGLVAAAGLTMGLTWESGGAGTEAKVTLLPGGLSFGLRY